MGPAVMPSGGSLERALYSLKRRLEAEDAMLGGGGVGKRPSVCVRLWWDHFGGCGCAGSELWGDGGVVGG
jgi:hypothetical protein